MSPGVEEDDSWGSQSMYLLVVLCQLISTPMFAVLPNVAVIHGTTGYMLSYLICYLAFGIPLLYMEFVITQFTARDCLQVWKTRPCLSHIGYILLIWQIFVISHNHVNVSFTLHYFILSFENPIPYYTCGEWSTSDCNILKFNYSVNQDCIKQKNPSAYCENLHTTFPEYQFWKFNILGMNKTETHFVAWRVCLASALISVMTYLSCLKKKKSLKMVVAFFTLYPICGYFVLLLGSMLQKGVVVTFEEALDSDFSVFFERFRFSLVVMQVINNLGVGSGLTFNLSFNTPFRAPCYTNTVIVVIICAASSVVAVFTTALMTCPYSYEYSMSPFRIIKANMALLYEKIPRMMYEYQNRLFWIILIFSCQVILGMSTNVILIFNMLEMMLVRFPKLANYPGLTTLFATAFLYFITIPFLGFVGTTTMLSLKRFFSFLTTFMAAFEILVFVLWYGLDKFIEDVHFMQGIQPKTYLKIAWLYSSIILLYVFANEIYIKYNEYKGGQIEIITWVCFLLTFGLILGILILKLVIAACKRKFFEQLRLDPTWGPKNEVLQRSRAMFTAQAMTKEYLYRQYHLQAGILMRNNASNCRAEQKV